MAGRGEPSGQARALARGCVAGVNRYVRDVGVANLPDARCRGAAWVRTYDEMDYWRSVVATQQPTLMAGVVAAAPPGAPDLPGLQAVAYTHRSLPTNR